MKPKTFGLLPGLAVLALLALANSADAANPATKMVGGGLVKGTCTLVACGGCTVVIGDCTSGPCTVVIGDCGTGPCVGVVGDCGSGPCVGVVGDCGSGPCVGVVGDCGCTTVDASSTPRSTLVEIHTYLAAPVGTTAELCVGQT